MSVIKSTLGWIGASVGVVSIGLVGYLSRGQVELGAAAPKGAMMASLGKDAKISESEYFYMVAQLLQRDYVEPIEVDNKMTLGAVKGMVNSLLDPQSMFMNKAQFDAFQKRQRGEINGIGVELQYHFDEQELKKVQSDQRTIDNLLLLPEVEISAVVPGSPADKAGLQVGDVIKKVGEKFTISGREIKDIRTLQTNVAKKLAPTEALMKARDELTLKIKSNIPPNRVREVLTSGTSGSVTLTVARAGKQITTKLAKSTSFLADVSKAADGSFAVRIFSTTPAKLASSRIPDGAILDFRQSTAGDFDAVLPTLAQLAPTGSYGQLKTERTTQVVDLKVENGHAVSKPYTILVDQTVSGAAKVVAQALVAGRVATLRGTLSPGGVDWIELFSLPEGGYTLCTGQYVKAEVTK